MVKFANLSQLFLSVQGGCNGLDGAELEAIVAGCSRLQQLSLSHSNVSDSELARIVKGCSKFSSLSLCHCPQITDGGMAAIASDCAHLSTLRLTDFRAMDAKNYHGELARWPRLNLFPEPVKVLVLL